VSLADTVFQKDTVWVGIRARINKNIATTMAGRFPLNRLPVRIVGGGDSLQQARLVAALYFVPVSTRRPTVTVRVGGVPVGSAHPIVVQSMTNTDTAAAAATAAQVRALHEAGSELVRVTVNTDEAARAVPAIVAE